MLVSDRLCEHERLPGLNLGDARPGLSDLPSSSPSPTSTPFGDAGAPISVPGVGQKAVPDSRS